MTSILFIDDEAKIRTFVRISLQAEGYTCYEASNVRQGCQMIQELEPALIILDLGLPDGDGLTVIRRLRQQQNITPIIVLSARDDEEVKIIALDSGANDYLSKPFGVRELLARIRAVLRDVSGVSHASQLSRIDFGPLTIDLEQHQVKLDGTFINLTPKEFELLTLFAQTPGKLLTHEYLLTRLWGAHQIQNTQYLRVCVSSLRKKINDISVNSPIIETIPALGYRFIASAE